jgi:hypothetical protein
MSDIAKEYNALPEEIRINLDTILKYFWKIEVANLDWKELCQLVEELPEGSPYVGKLRSMVLALLAKASSTPEEFVKTLSLCRSPFKNAGPMQLVKKKIKKGEWKREDFITEEEFVLVALRECFPKLNV